MKYSYIIYLVTIACHGAVMAHNGHFLDSLHWITASMIIIPYLALSLETDK